VKVYKEDVMRAVLIIMLFLYLSGCSAIKYEAGAVYKTDLQKTEDHSEEKNIISLINKARSEGRMCGSRHYKPAPPLAWNDSLGQAALKHSLDMAENGFLGHRGSDGSSPGDRILKSGYSWTASGENVGQSFRTPQEAVQGWLRTERHCRNIMNPEFREAGSAYAKSSSLRTYWTVVFGTPAR
jgi:uncharacterized protein YkwD